MDDLAGRRRDVFSKRERVGIGVAQLSAPQVGDQVLHPLDEVLAARFQRAFEHDRIGHREIGRTRRFRDGAGGEAQLLALVGRQAFHIVDHGERLLGEEEIGLVYQREGGMGAPARIGETLVLEREVGLPFAHCVGLRPDAVLAQHLFPQSHALFEQGLLLFDLGDRHLAVPVFGQAHPAGRIEEGHHRLGIGQLLLLIFQPHGLKLRADLGPMLHILGRHGGNRLAARHREQGRVHRRRKHGREHCLGELGGAFGHGRHGIRAEGVGRFGLVGHHRLRSFAVAPIGIKARLSPV